MYPSFRYLFPQRWLLRGCPDRSFAERRHGEARRRDRGQRGHRLRAVPPAGRRARVPRVPRFPQPRQGARGRPGDTGLAPERKVLAGAD